MLSRSFYIKDLIKKIIAAGGITYISKDIISSQFKFFLFSELAKIRWEDL